MICRVARTAPTAWRISVRWTNRNSAQNIVLPGGIDDAAIILVGQGVMVIRVDTGEQAVIKYKWQAFCQIAAGQPCVPSMKTNIHVDSTTRIFPLFEQGVRQMT